MSRSARRRIASIGVSAFLTAALAAVPSVLTSAAADAAPAPTAKVIVIGASGAMRTVAADVRHLGGHVTRDLQIIDGVAARVPVSALPALRAARGVRSVSPDLMGHLMSINPTLGYDPAKDDGSMYLIDQAIHARDAWNKGYTGKGVDVALIDSGVSPVAGLDNGNVINGPDLSFDSQNPDLTDLDGFGHGTHMASIIAGRDFVGTSSQYAQNNSQYLGVAPDARIVSVKVASGSGAADVSQVIAAINWVDQNAHSNGLNIKVLNLSYGTESTQPYTVDPLAYAAEQAWKHGIVVVVSGGNDGTSSPTLTDPAYDPNLLAVGAVDPNSTPSTGDDTVPDFSSRGNSSRHVDVVAPGMHVLGLRDPGSYVDVNNPTAEVGTRFFRGSGTSQAAAVVSGAAALILQRYPNATPNQVKAMLMATAASIKSNQSAQDRGSGEINVNSAIDTGPTGSAVLKLLTCLLCSSPSPAAGTGSLDAARGGLYVTDGNGNSLTGEQDIFGDPWNPASWTKAVANENSWGADGSWNGSVWTGTGFNGTAWASQNWGDAQWTSNSWAGTDWSSHHWTSHHWTGSGWSGSDWSDDGWAGHHWTATSWDSWSWG
jgi:serine protease AprX